MARGNIDHDQMRDACIAGNGYKFQMFGGGTVTAGHMAVYDSSGNVVDGGSPSTGTGSVTSVALTMPTEFSVAGSPVTGSGTLAVTKANENANTVWAGPSSGAAAAPAFRGLVAADVPVLTKVNGSALAVNIDNFSDTTPAAPAGNVNIKFQSDASGNISAYDPVGTWASWTPTYTLSAGMTSSVVSVNQATYIRMGPILFFLINVVLTLGGTMGPVVQISLPMPVVGPGQVGAAGVVYPGANYWMPATGSMGANTTSVLVTLISGVNYTAGNNQIAVTGFYHCA